MWFKIICGHLSIFLVRLAIKLFGQFGSKTPTGIYRFLKKGIPRNNIFYYKPKLKRDIKETQLVEDMLSVWKGE